MLKDAQILAALSEADRNTLEEFVRTAPTSTKSLNAFEAADIAELTGVYQGVWRTLSLIAAHSTITGWAGRGDATPWPTAVRVPSTFCSYAVTAPCAHIHFVRWLDLEERRAIVFDEHFAILDALEKRDLHACLDHMHKHIARRMKEIVKVVEAGVVRLCAR
jgi:hypothetical protein